MHGFDGIGSAMSFMTFVLVTVVVLFALSIMDDVCRRLTIGDLLRGCGCVVASFVLAFGLANLVQWALGEYGLMAIPVVYLILLCLSLVGRDVGVAGKHERGKSDKLDQLSTVATSIDLARVACVAAAGTIAGALLVVAFGEEDVTVNSWFAILICATWGVLLLVRIRADMGTDDTVRQRHRLWYVGYYIRHASATAVAVFVVLDWVVVIGSIGAGVAVSDTAIVMSVVCLALLLISLLTKMPLERVRANYQIVLKKVDRAAASKASEPSA